MLGTIVSEQAETMHAHTRRKTVKKETPLKPFVVWDGEGTSAGKGKPQNYSLFGAYNGEHHSYVTERYIPTVRALALITKVGRDNPKAIHISFAFGYDVTMILRDLPTYAFRTLKERGYVRWNQYRLEFIPGKWFTVTECGPGYPADPKDKLTVKIFDGWGFFQSSFLSAVKTNIADHPAMVGLARIEDGKANRSVFTYAKIDNIIAYWRTEQVLAHALFERLREYLYAVGLRITSWHGPGALASYAYTTNNIQEHKGEYNAELYDVARYAYAGGRFERFHIGRYSDRRIYGYDINSAYPNGIAKLPSLTGGTWVYVRNPKHIVEFGVYHIKMNGTAGDGKRAAPIFYRAPDGNISFPWGGFEGWYWSPETQNVKDHCMQETGWESRYNAEIIEGWEFHPATDKKPFAFVETAYAQRRDMKAAGIGAQMALKLMLNSLYGKMAQRAGWERTGEAPKWHQLDWAGWVTSYTRATLWTLMQKMPHDCLIAVETDGIYCTATPEELDVSDSKELGGWEVTEYDELIYLQSGVYAKRQGNEWETKYRGLDTGSLTAGDIVKHCKTLLPARNDWPKLAGQTTRFIGFQNALFRANQHRGSFKDNLGLWETVPHEIDCQSAGKRIHSHNARICSGCRDGLSAYDAPHDTIVHARMYSSADFENPTGMRTHHFSTKHDIPWLEQDTAKWRDFEESQRGLISA